MSRRLASLAMLAAVALASCGAEREAPALTLRETLSRAVAAATDGDVATLCELLSREGKVVIGHAQHGSFPLECREDVRNFTDSLRPYGNGRKPQLFDLDRTGVDSAVARYVLPDRMVVTARLSREDGTWRLDGLFDAPISQIQTKSAGDGSGDRRLPTERELALPDGVPPALAPGPRATSWRSAAGRQCPRVDVSRFPRITGGCVVELAGAGQRFTLQTPFGFMPFARCRISYDLHFEGDGGTWIAGFEIEGDSPCLDIVPCEGREQVAVPWRARIGGPVVDEGSSRLTAMACLDSCLGRFEGRWDVALTTAGNAWRASSRGLIGTSGLRIDGVAIGVESRRPRGGT